MRTRPHIAFFGSSLLSAYWNGATTYYRGIIRALHQRGYRVTFYEPNAFDRQQHRDIDPPSWAHVEVYEPTESATLQALASARDAQVVVKASGVGVFDELLEQAVLDLRTPRQQVLFWDVDAPATLERVQQNGADPFRPLIPRYDAILTYGGGAPVIQAYLALGARNCFPIYNAVDPDTHYPVDPVPRYQADLAFLGNRLPDRETRVREFFFRAAEALPHRRFLLGGNGWDQNTPVLSNVQYLGHVYSRDHNALNRSPLAVLNVNRQSMARFGYSPATRVFEAAGAGACIISDAWPGLETFLEPETEILVADDGQDVARHLARLTPNRAREIGAAAMQHVLADHTYAQRAALVASIFEASDSPIALTGT